MQLLKSPDHRRNCTKRRGDAATLKMNINAKATDVRNAQREIEFLLLLEFLLLNVGEDSVNEPPCIGSRKRRRIHVDQPSINANNRRTPHGKMQVGRIALDG